MLLIINLSNITRRHNYKLFCFELRENYAYHLALEANRENASTVVANNENLLDKSKSGSSVGGEVMIVNSVRDGRKLAR